eukprot:TRINITY_DN5624_c0_g1_i1.p1 TRINITY_DN5624_c0_g1~~TRINITY_DN5624_c0_g1_i1.p1  ORF type:complete len:305 (-),score=104.83 TRINITY_DN5624_c0_g1_i1:46-960(-)
MAAVGLTIVDSSDSGGSAHPVENVLEGGALKLWQTSTPSDEAYVDFKLDVPSSIRKVTIGNNGCAFLEVLVNKSTAESHWQVLLPITLLMSHAESQTMKNKFREWTFTIHSTPSALNEKIASEEWSYIRLYLRQNFLEKLIPIGLTYVKVFSGDLPSSSLSKDKENDKKVLQISPKVEEPVEVGKKGVEKGSDILKKGVKKEEGKKEGKTGVISFKTLKDLYSKGDSIELKHENDLQSDSELYYLNKLISKGSPPPAIPQPFSSLINIRKQNTPKQQQHNQESDSDTEEMPLEIIKSIRERKRI